eukprot:scaffold43944_cov59-Attheya_sp.AAC.5
MQWWTLPSEHPRGESGANMPTTFATSTPSSFSPSTRPATKSLGLCRQGSNWMLWAWSASWTPNRRKSLTSRGPNPSFGRILRPPKATWHQRARPPIPALAEKHEGCGSGS